MPWTEAFSTGDGFLRGGQDLELGLLAVLAFLCLVLVLSQHVRQAVHVYLSLFSLARCIDPLRRVVRALSGQGSRHLSPPGRSAWTLTLPLPI